MYCVCLVYVKGRNPKINEGRCKIYVCMYVQGNVIRGLELNRLNLSTDKIDDIHNPIRLRRDSLNMRFYPVATNWVIYDEYELPWPD